MIANSNPSGQIEEWGPEHPDRFPHQPPPSPPTPAVWDKVAEQDQCLGKSAKFYAN